MDIEQFEELVDRCGERPEDWPDEIRSDAIELLASSERAKQVVAEAAALREAFRRRPVRPAPAGFADRVLERASRIEQGPPSPDRAQRGMVISDGAHVGAWRSSIWLVICFAAGLAIGLSFGMMGMGRSTVDVTLLLAAVVR